MVLSELLGAITYGYYISAWKALPVLIVLLLWGRLLTWIDKDSQPIMLPRIPINIGMMLGGTLGFGLFFFLPGFLVAFLVLFGVVGAEAGTYLYMRNQKVGLKDLKEQFNDWLHSFTSKEKKVKEIKGEVQLIGKNNSLVAAPDEESPDRAPYEAVQTVLSEPLRRNAERIDLAPVDGTGAAVRYVVDGVTYTGSQIDAARAAGAIEFLKRNVGLNLAEKRKPQIGTMKVSVDGSRRELQVQTAGSSSGEQLRVMVNVKTRHNLKLEELGMTQRQLDMIKELIKNNSGMVLVSAPKGQGLTSALYGILRAHDAFLTLIHTVETASDTDLEGITQNKLPPGTTPAEELKQLSWVSSQEPEVLMVASISDAKSAQMLAKYASEHRVYLGLRANNTFDTLTLYRKLIGDDKLAFKDLRLIINCRVMRRLCAACKEGYTPDPATLRKLNMDPEKVGNLFQARRQPIRDPKGNPIPCEFCKELHFKGRIGVYETLVIDDEIKSLFQSNGSMNQLKALFRKQRGKYLQEQALSQVEAGETSVQEVLRVMKPEGGQPQAGRPKPTA